MQFHETEGSIIKRTYHELSRAIWVFPQNRGNYPNMDGENNGKPYFLMDDLGVPLFLETPIC